MSYYSDLANGWNKGKDDDEGVEQVCRRCNGSGSDDDGADCIFCMGYGSVMI